MTVYIWSASTYMQRLKKKAYHVPYMHWEQQLQPELKPFLDTETEKKNYER